MFGLAGMSTPSGMAFEPQFYSGELRLKGVTLTTRHAELPLNPDSFASFLQFVNILRLAWLVLTSVEYRFDGGIIKLPVNAKALSCSPLSSYLNGWGY